MLISGELEKSFKVSRSGDWLEDCRFEFSPKLSFSYVLSNNAITHSENVVCTFKHNFIDLATGLFCIGLKAQSLQYIHLLYAYVLIQYTWGSSF